MLFKEKGSNEVTNEAIPFALCMQLLAKEAFDGLFAFLNASDQSRIIDCLLVMGFEFLHKLLIAILSKFETKIINSVNKGVKMMKGNSKDSLIVIGISAFNQLVRNKGGVNVDALIKKCAKKQSYLKENLATGKEIFNRNVEVVKRIGNAKERFKNYEVGLFQEIIQKVKENSLESRVNSISLQNVLEKFGIVNENIISFIALLIDELSESFAVVRVVCLLAILSNFRLENKLKLLFNGYSSANSDFLTGKEGVEVVLTLDSFTVSQKLREFEISLTESVSYGDFLDILFENHEYSEILDILNTNGVKSRTGSYLNLDSQNDKETYAESPEYFSESEEESIELPENYLKNQENPPTDRKCTRFCAQTCIIT